MGSDVKAVTRKVIQIIGFVNTMFSQLKLTVVISSIEIWSNKNKISTTGNPNNILSRFLEWKYKHIFRPHQVAYLFAFKKHPSFLGATFPGKICNKNFAVGVALNCTHKDCCDARICLMKKGKQCGSGECCTLDCKLKPIGIQCRKSLDECDFPEYCNGVSSHCVPDTYARDGQSCDSGDAYCFGGRCRIHNKQCKDLIGGASRGGPFACYEEVNTRGDRYGNCGRDFCSNPNLLCGKLVCAWPHKTLISRANLSVIYTHVQDEMCVSTFRPNEKLPKNSWTTFENPEDRDDTFVQDGTVCGPEMYCVKFVCVKVQYQITDEECNSTYCNSHGICNNLNHCQCEKGFDPPTCLQKKGEFGSIDDGHKAPSGLCLSNFINQRQLCKRKKLKYRFQARLQSN
uniref:Disintegrin and metalloproteinase domain-containing protein 5-like n=1 Tax=Neovison vison TaxID=452646 RepID=A0A8C7AZP8_NEOVI